jgi:hypothetical protein
MFIIFVRGPREALIPLFMYPAAQQSAGLVVYRAWDLDGADPVVAQKVDVTARLRTPGCSR